MPAEVTAELGAYKIAQQEFRLSIGIGRLSPDDLLFPRVDRSARKPNDLSRDWLVATEVIGRPMICMPCDTPMCRI